MDRLRLTDIEPAEPAHPPAHDAGVLAPAPPAAQILLLQRQAGNQAVARMLGARAAPRAVARVTQTAVLTAVGSGGGSDAGPPGALTADPDADFNPWSIVHDLRRAIDQAEISEWDPESKVMRPTKRKVDAGLVMRVLDGLTADQVARVKRIYETQEKTTLENDLFEGGQSNAQSSLKPDQRARIKVLLEGTAQKAGGGASENRLEALAIELHELLAGSLDEAKRERVMTIHRRPAAENSAIEAAYERRYQHGIDEDQSRKLGALHYNRAVQLRMGNVAKADALAIEEKRRKLDELQEKRETGRLDLSEMASYESNRRKLIDGITGILDMNRQEAMAGKTGEEAEAAIGKRIADILSTPHAEPGSTLKQQLDATLEGTAAAGVVSAMARGSLVDTAAHRLIEMEARDNTNSAKIAELIRGLRKQGETDAIASIPGLPMAEKQALLADPVGRREQIVRAHGKRYVDGFIAAYEALRPTAGRPWKRIVESSDSENEEMLNALVTGGGQMADVDELRFAIRKKNAAGIKAVLQKQLTQERIKTLKDQYREKFGDDLNQLLFGRLGAEFAMGPQAAMLGNAGGVVRGRDAAHVEEYLNAVGEKEAGGGKEVDALVKYGKLEVDVTEDNSGAMGALREIGDDPDTQKMMNASSRQLQDLAKAWKANPGNPRLQQAIVAEMRKVRATLTGDATAYEEENEQLRAQLRSAVSFAVQIALAVALPGAGPGIAGFLTSTALNIGATVASNMVIYGDQYSLKMLYNDVVGGGLGALGGKFGEDVAKMVAGNASRGVAGAAVEAGLPATKLAGQVDAAAAMAREGSFGVKAAVEASNIVGSTAATSAATGENGFTFEAMLQNVLMNRIGGLRDAVTGGPGGGRPAAGDGAAPATAVPAGDGTAPATTVPAGSAPVAGGGPATLPAGAPMTRPDGAPATLPAGAPAPARPDGAPAPTRPDGVPPEALPTGTPDAPARVPGADPTRPVGEAAPPGGSAGPAPAGAGAAGPVRPAGATERLEARGMWRGMEQVASEWPGMADPGRRARLADVANPLLAARDIPSVTVAKDPPQGAGNEAEFDYKQWAIRIDPALIRQASLDPKAVAHLTELVRHEAEHALQWWSMARLRASQGAEPAQIIAEMHGLDPQAAQHAYDTFKRDGMSKAEQAAAQVWWDSVYSPTSSRSPNLDQRKAYRELFDRLDGEIKAAEGRGETVEPGKLHERDRVRAVAEGFDALYRGLPEEIPAFQKGQAAGDEAVLQQAQLEVDLAKFAVDEARKDVAAAEQRLKGVEDRYLEQIVAGAQPDPALAAAHERQIADHNGQVERMRGLQDKLDRAEAARDAEDAWITGGGTPAAEAAGAAPTPVQAPAGAGGGAGPAAGTAGTAPAMPGGSATRKRKKPKDPLDEITPKQRRDAEDIAEDLAERQRRPEDMREEMPEGSEIETVDDARARATVDRRDVAGPPAPQEGDRPRTKLAKSVPPPGEPFIAWFDSLSLFQLDKLLAQRSTSARRGARDIIQENIRHPGTYHEWLMVAEARKVKEWGVSMRTVLQGRSFTEATMGRRFRHGAEGSGTFHEQLRQMIRDSNSFPEYVEKLNRWADDNLVPSHSARFPLDGRRGRYSLPETLQARGEGAPLPGEE